MGGSRLGSALHHRMSLARMNQFATSLNGKYQVVAHLQRESSIRLAIWRTAFYNHYVIDALLVLGSILQI